MSSESVQPEVADRTLRALQEYHTVIEEARGLFQVVSESGKTYRVDLAEPACSCEDFQYRSEELGEEGCKHIRRVRLEVGQVDTDTLEARLAKTADDLDANAADLEQQAEELAEIAEELRNALDRLEEVAR